MNEPGKHPNSDNDLTKDQLAEKGIETDPSGSDSRRSDNYREDLAEEATWPIPGAKTDSAPKSTSAPSAETQGEDSDYCNGMSQ